MRPGGREDGDEKQGEFGGAFLQPMLGELVAVLARCHPSGVATQHGLEAEEQKDGGSFQEAVVQGLVGAPGSGWRAASPESRMVIPSSSSAIPS